jgi:hypothetical protein
MADVVWHYIRHAVALWRERVWWHSFAIIWLCLGVFIVYRDEFWEPTDENSWRIIRMIPHFSLEWWLVGTLSIIIVWLFESSSRHARHVYEKYGLTKDGKLPLVILFDRANKNQKYWSLKPVLDVDGKQVGGSYWEYRVVIRNQSHKTLRNVITIVEAIGPMPQLPIQ